MLLGGGSAGRMTSPPRDDTWLPQAIVIAKYGVFRRVSCPCCSPADRYYCFPYPRNPRCARIVCLDVSGNVTERGCMCGARASDTESFHLLELLEYHSWM